MARLLGFRHYGIRRARRALDVLVRWGSMKPMPEATMILNPARAILLASDKVLAIERMQAAGLPTVPLFYTWEEAIAQGNSGIILGRSRRGMQGWDISIYDPSDIHQGHYLQAPVAPHEWYTLYHEPTREIRLHVVDGEVVRIQGKYLDFPQSATENPFVRNHRSGYRYRKPRRKLRTQRREIAIEAVRALGLTFGAVDMLLFGGHLDPMVLEVNTAPACSPLTASAYAEALVRRMSND
jgi:glutathione synthase/RimK-type ligase-like ATP-grasp enzyme